MLNLTGAFVPVHTVYKDRLLEVTCIHIANCGATPATVRVCVVPSSGTAQQANALLWDFAIPANDFIEMSDGLLLDRGSSLQALTSAPATVNLFLSGLES
jgi:hypothetical protein